MRALTLWQPWAACVALGWKPLENRRWTTPHRGTLAITAAKRLVNPAHVEEALNMRMRSLPFMRMPPERGGGEYREARERQRAELAAAMVHTGCVLAVVNLAQVLPGSELTDAQRIWYAGDDHLGFILGEVRRLARPVPCRGLQKLWELSADVEQLVRAQL